MSLPSASSLTFCLVHLLLVLLLLLCFLPSPASAISLLSASGDGTCVTVGSYAVNCTMPFTLRVQTAELAYPIGAYVYLYWYVHGILQFNLRVQYNPTLPAALNDTANSISFAISADPFAIPAGQLLNFTIRDWGLGGGETALAPLFSLVPPSFPTISAVSGCQAPASPSPLLTLNCYAEVDVLTLTGTGFTSLTTFSIVRTVGGQSDSRGPFPRSQWGAAVLSDTQLTLNLTGINFVFLEEHYAGQLIALSFSWPSGYQTDSFSLSMAALPAPVVISMSGNPFPVLIDNVTRFLNVIPGQSVLSVYGRWLYNMTMTVGGASVLESDRSYALSTYASFVMPSPTPYVGGVLTDVTLSNYQGVVSYPGLVAFTPNPFITGMSKCWFDNDYWWEPELAHCRAGDTLSISGRLFSSRALANVSMTYGGAAGLFCGNATVVSDTLLTCTVPPAQGRFDVGATIGYQANWADGNSTKSWTQITYDFSYAPRILSVSGCGMTSALSDGLALYGCELGQVITMSGTGLIRSGSSLQWTGVSGMWVGYGVMTPNFYCVEVAVDAVDNTSLTCLLPNATEWSSMQQLQPYAVLLSPAENPRAWLGSSNAFLVSFGTAPPSASGQDSGGDSGSGGALVAALASVFSVLAVAGLLVALWWVWRSRGKKGGGFSDEQLQEDGGTRQWMRHRSGIELADK